jgi:hypothetical protein
MKCSFCEAAGQRSTLEPDSFGTSTCIGFSMGHYDESGAWVAGRDPNTHTQGYWCSRGHRFYVASQDGQPDRITLDESATRIAPLKVSNENKNRADGRDPLT